MLLFIVFMLSMGAYMLYSSKEKPEKDYYEQDLIYEKTMEAQKNARELPEKPTINYDKTTNILRIEFAKDTDITEGKLQLLKVSDQKKDLFFKLLPNQNIQEFPLPKETKGSYNIVISWKSKKISYQLSVISKQLGVNSYQ
jgi:hypothetical protein